MEKNKEIIIRTRGIILDGDKLLVVKHAPDDNYFALPGGHLEFGEDIKESLKREITEELGVDPKIGRLLYINNFVFEGITQSIEFFFEINNSHEFKEIENLDRTHAFEISQILWVSPSDEINILPKGFAEDFESGKVISDQTRFLYS